MANVERTESPEFYNEYGGSLEGEISVPISPSSRGKDQAFDTLDEPIRDTIIRDLKAVGVKFLHILYPKYRASLLRDWDLWGPLILCVFLAMMLQGPNDDQSDKNDGGPEFAQVFVIVWVGSMIVTLNSKLLGGKISFFQSVCVLGYCLLPPALALIICKLILLISTQSTLLFVVRFFVTMLGFAWATFASMSFLGNSQPPRRKALAVYPMGLFYFIISWMVISNTHTL